MFALPFAGFQVKPVKWQQPNPFFMTIKTERHVRRTAVSQQVYGWRVGVFRLPTTFRAVRRSEKYSVVVAAGVTVVKIHICQ